MKKHGVLLDMINDCISFSPKYYSHPRASWVRVPTISTDETEIISIAIQQNVLPNRILKRSSAERIDDFLKISEKISDKKRRLINAFKQKLALQKRKPETVVISLLDNSGKKDIPILPRTPKICIGEADLAMIGADAYCAACRLKGAQVIVVSMRDLEYQAGKEARSETDPRSVILEEYHDLLDIFSKKDSDTLLFHRKYDHKIILEEQQRHGHASLYKILPQKLNTVKCYLHSHLAKGFIQVSSAPYLSLVLFVKKLGGRIQFCVDYRRLNAINRKDQYLISLIKETLA